MKIHYLLLGSLLCSFITGAYGQDHVISENEDIGLRMCIGNQGFYEHVLGIHHLKASELRLVSAQRVERECFQRKLDASVPVVQSELVKIREQNSLRSKIQNAAPDLAIIHQSLRAGQWCPSTGCWDAPVTGLIRDLLTRNGSTIDQLVGVDASEKWPYVIIYYDDLSEVNYSTAPPPPVAVATPSPATWFKGIQDKSRKYMKDNRSRLVRIVKDQLGLALAQADFDRMDRSIAHATLVAEKEWPALFAKYEAGDPNGDAGLTVEGGNIYLKRQGTGDQVLSASYIHLLLHEGIHALLIPKGTSDAQDVAVMEQLFKEAPTPP